MGRINGENIAGAAFLFLASIFIAAGMVNDVIASIRPVFYIFISAGIALVFLGYRTWRNEVMSAESEVVAAVPANTTTLEHG
jgi:threonine/homoserine/homoserine lactone efflux protein